MEAVEKAAVAVVAWVAGATALVVKAMGVGVMAMVVMAMVVVVVVATAMVVVAVYDHEVDESGGFYSCFLCH